MNEEPAISNIRDSSIGKSGGEGSKSPWALSGNGTGLKGHTQGCECRKERYPVLFSRDETTNSHDSNHNSGDD